MLNDTPWLVLVAWCGALGALGLLFVIVATPQWALNW